MSLWEGFLWGVLGGFFAELLGWFKLRYIAPDDHPDWMSTKYYWIVTCLMMLAGGMLVVAYMRSQVNVSSIMALNVGASAPLILGALVNQAPPIPIGKID